MNSSKDIDNNSISMLYQNKVFFYFALILGTLLIVFKLPMVRVYYETISTLITFAPLVVVLVMAVLAFIKGKQYPDYKNIIRKFYLLFMLKFLIGIFVFYVFYSPYIFYYIFLAFFQYLKTVLTLEGVFFFLTYLLTIVLALSAVHVFFRLYQQSQGKYAGSMSKLIKNTLYSLFGFFFATFVFSVAAYPEAYKPLTDTLGDTMYTMSNGGVQLFKGDDSSSYNRIDSLGQFASSLSSSISRTSKSISLNNQEFKSGLDTARKDLSNSIVNSSKDLNDKIKEDLSGKVSVTGGTVEGSLILYGKDSDLTVEGKTTTKDILPDSNLEYNLGDLGKSWNTIYAHRLIGASPIFIGNGFSNRGLDNDGDLVVTNNAEIQGILFAKRISINGTYELPTTDGNSNQMLITNGNGSLSWTNQLSPGGSTGQLQFNDGGSFASDTQLFWDNSSKRLGIGNSNPQSELDVSGGTVRAKNFFLTDLGVYLNPNDVNSNYWAQSSGNIYRETGFIGVGTNNPIEAFDLNGRIHLAQSSAPTNATDRLYNVLGDLYWNGMKVGENFWTKNGNNAIFNLAGNVGIGTDPTTKLEVAGTIRATNFFDATTGTYLVPGSVNGNYWSNSSGNISRETGDVAIGSNNSNGFKLYVDGNISGTGNLNLAGTLSSAGSITSPTFIGTLQGNADTVTNGVYSNGSYADPAWLTSLSKTKVGLSNVENTALSTWAGTSSINTLGTISAGIWNGNLIGLAYGGTGSSNGSISGSSSLAFSAGGTNQNVTLTPSGSGYTILGGNVGIGTTSPGYPLDVQSATSQLQISSTITTNYALLRVLNAGGNLFFGREQNTGGGLLTGSTGYASVIASAGTYPFQIGVNNAISMTVLNGGNVGIGTTSPGSLLTVSKGIISTIEGGAALDSTVLIRQNTSTAGASALEFGFGGSGANYLGSRIVSDVVAGGGADLYFQTGTGSSGTYTTKMIIKKDGNVGIGTTGPSAKLEVNAINGSLINPFVAKYNNVALFAVNSGAGITLKNPSGNTTIMTVDPSGNGFFNGNVGIGTTTPGSKLDVVSTLASASGTDYGMKILPTYNQTSTAGATDLLINRTQTAVGSGTQNLIDAQVGGVSKFSVNNLGYVTAGLFSGQVRGTYWGDANAYAGMSQGTSVAGNRANLLFGNTAGNDFTSLQFGGLTSVYPALRSINTFSGTQTALQVIAADGTSNANLLVTGNVGIGTTSPGSKLDVVSALASASGTDYGMKILPTYNQASTAGATDLLINRTQTAVGSGAQLLIDAQVGGVSKFSVSNSGVVNAGNNVNITGGGILNLTTVRPLAWNNSINLVDVAVSSSTAHYQVNAAYGTLTNSSGVSGGLSIAPTYNQTSSTAANTDLLINRTQTSVGSGAQLLIDAQVGGVTRFNVSNTGAGYLLGASWTYGSDQRLKENINPLAYGLSEIEQLNPMEFDYINGQKNQLGFIAQDVQQILPELVKTMPNGMLGLQTEGILPIMVNAIKQQQTMIAGISTKQDTLSTSLSSHSDSLATLLLKTDTNITTLNQLQVSTDEQFAKVSTILTQLSDNTKTISDIQNDNRATSNTLSSHSESLLSLSNLTQTLQQQIDELNVRTNSELNLARLDLSTQQISFLNTLLGTERVANPADIDLLGKLSALSIETGKLTAKDVVTDTLTMKENETSGQGTITAGQMEITISTTQATESAKISITAKGSTAGKILYFDEIRDGKSFKVKMDAPALDKDVNFVWLIVK